MYQYHGFVSSYWAFSVDISRYNFDHLSLSNVATTVSSSLTTTLYLKPTHQNVIDGIITGVEDKKNKVIAVQYNPAPTGDDDFVFVPGYLPVPDEPVQRFRGVCPQESGIVLLRGSVQIVRIQEPVRGLAAGRNFLWSEPLILL